MPHQVYIEDSKINNEYLILLKKDTTLNQIVIDYLEVVRPFIQVIDVLCNLCDDDESDISEIYSYISNSTELNNLSASYRYCVKLNGTFQAFQANNLKFLKEIESKLKIIQSKFAIDAYNIREIFEEKRNFKLEIKEKYQLWYNAFCLNRMYNLCKQDNSILTFSHRIDGFSNPVFHLTENFQIEIKTNFGYGRSSYFYTKFKFRNIDITPYSEWISYRFADFNEINRYTFTHLLQNEKWAEALSISCEACNLSINNEELFIDKFILNECEKMVSGLESILVNEQFTFKNYKNESVETKFNGIDLIEFRGEKISGALEFIDKIKELENIASIASYIKRIIICNKKISPILKDEIAILKIQIQNLEDEYKILEPKLIESLAQNENYDSLKVYFKEQIIEKKVDFGEVNIDEYVELKFIEGFPIYIEFLNSHERLIEQLQNLLNTSQNYQRIHINFQNYSSKIDNYINQ